MPLADHPVLKASTLVSCSLYSDFRLCCMNPSHVLVDTSQLVSTLQHPGAQQPCSLLVQPGLLQRENIFFLIWLNTFKSSELYRESMDMEVVTQHWVC